MINFQLTSKCNFKCSHCLWSCNRNGKHASDSTILKALNLISDTGAGVNIIGGEPTLHPKFGETMRDLSRYIDGAPVRLVTNGSWVYSKKKTAVFLESLYIFLNNTNDIEYFSVLVSDDPYHREFWKSNNHIKLCKDAIHDEFYSEFYGEYTNLEYCNNFNKFGLGEDYRQYDRIVSMGRGRNIYGGGSTMDNQQCDCAEFRDYIEDGDFYVWDKPTIDPHGNISPCCQGAPILGNIHHDGLDILKGRIKTFAKYSKANKYGDCASCKQVNKNAIKKALNCDGITRSRNKTTDELARI
jgi:hypothetical protein